MRIEHIVSRYEHQAYQGSKRHREPPRRLSKATALIRGSIDMVFLTPEIENSSHTVDGLTDVIRLISDEALNDWMKNSFCQPCSREDLIVEKLLLEIL